ncbi:MAG: hypothetical protein U0V70_03640 [Terriglobia bacterium]
MTEAILDTASIAGLCRFGAAGFRHESPSTGRGKSARRDENSRGLWSLGFVWYNSELKSKNYIVPGLIAVILMIISALLTSLTIAREWEMGTMEQINATGAGELVLGKTGPSSPWG